MAPEDTVDPSKPNAGRIYDYILGGQHNYEADRLVAEKVLKSFPWTRQLTVMQRQCLQGLSIELTHKRGYDVVIDFGSGLPTQEHIHTTVAPGTKVIYSDRDPVVVAQAREILGATPNVYYLQADARQPELLLNSPEMHEIIGDQRDVALVYWGLTSYLTDEEIKHAASVLYEWTGPRACWAYNAQIADVNVNDPRIREIADTWAKMGSPFYMRSLKVLEQLLDPWHPDVLGFISLLEWHNLPREAMSESDRVTIGVSGGGYGAYLIK